jgi:hypothetical protein
MSGDLKRGRYIYYRCAGTKGCKRFYPEKLLEGETRRLLSSLQIDEAFWAERNAAWQTELAEVNGELLAIENAPPKADLLAAARKPV